MSRADRPGDDLRRPPLDLQLTGRELRRWYWTMAELQPFARSLPVSASGPKAALIDRIAAALDGVAPPTTSGPAKTTDQLPEPLTRDTLLPRGQRATTALRRFFESEIGPSFRFDGHMRAFVKEGGATLGAAVDHWHRTRDMDLPPQSKSLEFNRFTRAWHAAHPDRPTAEARAAWRRYRDLPVDQRPPVADA